MTSSNNIPTDDKTFNPLGPSEIPSIIADIEKPSPYAEDDPARPVSDLIESMAPQRTVLMGILRFCQDSARISDVNAEVDRLKEFLPSVYTAADLCTLLEETGGLERLTQDGNPYDMTFVEPSIVEEDGIRYYVANEPNDIFWHTTDAGATIIADDDPVGRAQEFFEQDQDLLPLFKRTLTLCMEDGCTLEGLNDAINDDPLAQSPRVYAPYFIDRLERCDAIEWSGIWRTTDTGTKILALLDDVADESSSEE